MEDDPASGGWLFQGTGQVLDPAQRDRRWPPPPRWRDFDGGPDQPPPPASDPAADRRLGPAAVDDTSAGGADPAVLRKVNAALYLRQPLLVTGPPGSGKSTLAYRIARELGLGRVLSWPVTTRTTIQSGLYGYDAIGRAQAGDDAPVGEFVRLGPLGTALLPHRLPRVLLIDELDNGDLDLPYELRNLFGEGEFAIPELARSSSPAEQVHTADPGGTAMVRSGWVRCHAFPVVVVTSTGERELPAPFVRRCAVLTLPEPDEEALATILAAHFPDALGGPDGARALARACRAEQPGVAVDQLLDAVALGRAAAHAVPAGSPPTGPEQPDGH